MIGHAPHHARVPSTRRGTPAPATAPPRPTPPHGAAGPPRPPRHPGAPVPPHNPAPPRPRAAAPRCGGGPAAPRPLPRVAAPPHPRARATGHPQEPCLGGAPAPRRGGARAPRRSLAPAPPRRRAAATAPPPRRALVPWRPGAPLTATFPRGSATAPGRGCAAAAAPMRHGTQRCRAATTWRPHTHYHPGAQVPWCRAPSPRFRSAPTPHWLRIKPPLSPNCFRAACSSRSFFSVCPSPRSASAPSRAPLPNAASFALATADVAVACAPVRPRCPRLC